MFVFSDIHGNWTLYKEIKEYIAGRPAIFLGDAIDRGPDGYKIMKDILDSKNIVYLKGNHEDMFVDAADELWEAREEGMYENDIRNFITNVAYHYESAVDLALFNGGMSTLMNWVEEGMNKDIVNRVRKLGIAMSMKADNEVTYDFCHAGCFKESFKNGTPAEHEALWSRDHFNEPWFDHRVLVHGHTFIGSVAKYSNGSVQPPRKRSAPLFYHNDSKICMDLRTASSGIAAVLEIPSMETKTFAEWMED